MGRKGRSLSISHALVFDPIESILWFWDEARLKFDETGGWNRTKIRREAKYVQFKAN